MAKIRGPARALRDASDQKPSKERRTTEDFAKIEVPLKGGYMGLCRGLVLRVSQYLGYLFGVSNDQDYSIWGLDGPPFMDTTNLFAVACRHAVACTARFDAQAASRTYRSQWSSDLNHQFRV